MHGVIDENEVPVTHRPRRSGRPFTLVLEKTHALVEREASARSEKEQALGMLRPQRPFAPPGKALPLVSQAARSIRFK